MTVELYCGDCLEIMKSIPDKSVDMVFTSPPFKEDDVNGDYWKLYDQWMREFFRIASKVIIIIQSATNLNNVIAKYPPKRTMVWGKGISQYSWRWNPIFVYQISDDYKINKYIWGDSFGVEAVTGKWKVHKYQDPILLYSTVIKMFKDCQTILDPFMGSGTTWKACKENERDFIVIEIDEKIFHDAQQQMRLELS